MKALRSMLAGLLRAVGLSALARMVSPAGSGGAGPYRPPEK